MLAGVYKLSLDVLFIAPAHLPVLRIRDYSPEQVTVHQCVREFSLWYSDIDGIGRVQLVYAPSLKSCPCIRCGREVSWNPSVIGAHGDAWRSQTDVYISALHEVG